MGERSRQTDAATEPKPQIAAVPFQVTNTGKFRVLMVTSRGTGRWVIPKGWEMNGLKPWKAAAIEAMEEAGAEGQIGRLSLGSYHYEKWISEGKSVPCQVQIYPMRVKALRTRWKEQRDRTRRWFSLKGAAREVHEPELRDLFLSLAQKGPRKHKALRTLI